MKRFRLSPEAAKEQSEYVILDIGVHDESPGQAAGLVEG